MMTDARRKELMDLAKVYAAAPIKDDLEGGSENLKELWEACHSKEETAYVSNRLRQIVFNIERVLLPVDERA